MNTGLTPSPLDAHLRVFTPAEAALTRLVGAPFADSAGNPWQLRLAEHTAPMQAPLRLTIGSSLCAADVVVDGTHYPALHAIAHEDDEARRTALAGLWLMPVLEGLSAAGLGDAVLTTLALALAPHPSTGLPMRLEGAPGDIACRIAELDWHATPPAPPMADSAAVLAHLGTVAMPTGLRIATRRCAANTLASLAPGDVLLGWNRSAYHPHQDEGPVQFTFGDGRQPRFVAHAHYKEGTVTILDFPTLADDDAPTVDETAYARAGETADGIAIDRLEVPVHLELAVMSLPLAELAALAPGHVLQLPVLLRDASVRLTCHGQTLGHGQLVAVGEHLGLQISAMSARHAEH